MLVTDEEICRNCGRRINIGDICECKKPKSKEKTLSEYNKALEDFKQNLLKQKVIDKSVVMRICEQLKVQ